MAKFFIDGEDFNQEEIARLCDALAPLAEADAPLLLEVMLVDEEEIQTLNREQRGIDRVTDVLSFPSMDGIFGQSILQEEHGEELDEEGRLYLGSIALCEKRAREQAQEYGHSYERELYYLITHGALHCLGYDHETDGEKAQMRLQEERVMKDLKLTRD